MPYIVKCSCGITLDCSWQFFRELENNYCYRHNISIHTRCHQQQWQLLPKPDLCNLVLDSVTDTIHLLQGWRAAKLFSRKLAARLRLRRGVTRHHDTTWRPPWWSVALSKVPFGAALLRRLRPTQANISFIFICYCIFLSTSGCLSSRIQVVRAGWSHYGRPLSPGYEDVYAICDSIDVDGTQTKTYCLG